jgi:hypothetical protein
MGRVRAILVPLTLLALAGLLWAGPWSFVSPVRPPTDVPAWAVDTAPVRHPTLRPEITLAGFTYGCSDCHKLFPSPPETTRSLTQHRDIELKHGINTRCFNCHHRTNRDAFVDDWGREIPPNQPQLLCAKCHGPVYRDWLHGSHGRTNGYWDKRQGPQQRRKCIECHDPHQPPFPPMPPAPAPNTLRMGNQRFPPERTAVTNPLRLYRRPDGAPSEGGRTPYDPARGDRRDEDD